MSSDVTVVTDAIFGVQLTRASAERAVAEAEAVESLKGHPRFAALLDGWRVTARSRHQTLRLVKAEEFAGEQQKTRLAHVLDDVLADIALMGAFGRRYIEQDDKVRPEMVLPARITHDDAADLVREGREVQQMLDHPGWPVVMERMAEQVRVHDMALETCPAELREFHQEAIKKLTHPVRIMHEAVRLGLVAGAWLDQVQGEQR